MIFQEFQNGLDGGWRDRFQERSIKIWNIFVKLMMSLIFQLCVDECTQLIKEVEQIVYTAVTTRLSNFPQKK